MPGTFTPSGPWTSRQCRTASSRGMPSLNLTSQMTLYTTLLFHQTLLEDRPPLCGGLSDRSDALLGATPRGRRQRADQRRAVLEPVLGAAVEAQRDLRGASRDADRVAGDVEDRARQPRYVAQQRLRARDPALTAAVPEPHDRREFRAAGGRRDDDVLVDERAHAPE